MSIDYYKILDLDNKASDRDIAYAYRRLTQKWHPDKHLTNKDIAEKKFKEITRAYKVLTNKEKRRKFDTYGKVDEDDNSDNKSTDKWKELNKNEDMRKMFGDLSILSKFNEKFPGFEAYNNACNGVGTTKPPNPKIKRKVTPPPFHPNHPGQAEFENQIRDILNNGPIPCDMPANTKTTNTIDTAFKLYKNEYDVYCTLNEMYNGGIRRITIPLVAPYKEKTKTIDLYIKPGWIEGTLVVYKGIGKSIRFNIKEIPHAIFKRSDYDIETIMRITSDDASRGFKKKLKLLDKEEHDIEADYIPSSEYILKIPNKGLPMLDNDKVTGHGNLNIKFIIDVIKTQT